MQKNQPNLLLLRLLTVLACVLPLSAGADDFVLSSPAIESKVIEQATGKPVPNALVVMLWEGLLNGAGTVCFRTETTATDGTGNYRIPAWQKTLPQAVIVDPRHAPIAYKPGYAFAEANRDTVILKPFTGTNAERLRYLASVEQSVRACRTPGSDEKNLLPLYRALYEEAKGLAGANGDRRVVDEILAGIEIIELGYQEGMRRAVERDAQRNPQP